MASPRRGRPPRPGAREDVFVRLLQVAEDAFQRLEAACAAHGVTHTQYNVLRILRGVHPDGHPRFAIADRLIQRAPDVTRLLDRLEAQGLVRRGWRPDNRRQSIATITEHGLALLERLDPEIERVQRDVLAPLPAADLSRLGGLLARLRPDTRG